MLNYKTYKLTKYAILASFALFYFIMTILISTKTFVPKTDNLTTSILIQVAGVILSILPLLVEYIFKIKFSIISIVIYSLFCFSSMGLGSGLGFYNIFSKYDLIVHFFSGVIVFFLFYTVFSKAINKELNLKQHLLITFLFTICFTVFVGVLWEVWEFTTDHFFNLNSQRHSLLDGTPLLGHNAVINTMLDLIADGLGGIVCGIIITIYFCIKKKHPSNLLTSPYKIADNSNVSNTKTN